MMGQKKKGKRNYYHRLLFINRPLPLSSSHLNGFIERCELRKSRTNSLSRVFSRFERDEQLVIGNENLVECVCLSSKFFPPLVFPALVFKKGKNSRGVGDDLDIPSPRPVVSWKFTLTSTKDLCAFHRVRARKRKFDRVWSWMYSNDLEYLRPFLVGQGASWFRSYTFHTFSLSLSVSLTPSHLSWIRNVFNFSLPLSLSVSFSALLSMNLSKRWIRYNRSEIKKRRASSRKVYEVSRKLTRVGEEGEGSIFNLALFYES